MRIERPHHERLARPERWLFRTVKLDAVGKDLSAICCKFGLNQDTFKIRSGLELIRLKNNRATSCGIFANFNNSGIKARHKNGLAQLQTGR